MHICFVETGYPHPHGGGGAGTYVKLVGGELIRRGYRVSVVAGDCPQCSGYEVDGGIEVYRERMFGRLHWYLDRMTAFKNYSLAVRYLEYGWRVYRRVTAIHARNPISMMEFSEGGDYWHHFRAPFPYVSHLHGARSTFKQMAGEPVDERERQQRKLELAFIRKAGCVISPSQMMLDLVTRQAGKPFQNTIVLPYPLDPKLLKNANGVRHRENGKLRVMFAARNDPVKGASVLINAAPAILQQVPGIEIHLFGYQPGAGEEIPEGVIPHPFIDRETLLNEYTNADVCVVPSLWDNSPYTVYEAMAAGKPVVASRVGGIPELVADGHTGWLVEPGNVDALAAAITRLLVCREERLAFGEAGRKRIVELANLDKNVNQRVEIYQRIIQSRLP